MSPLVLWNSWSAHIRLMGIWDVTLCSLVDVPKVGKNCWLDFRYEIYPIINLLLTTVLTRLGPEWYSLCSYLAAGWTTEESWFDSREGKSFLSSPKPLQWPWRPPSLLFDEPQRFFPRGKADGACSCRSVVLLVQRLRMSGSIPPLPYKSSWLVYRKLYHLPMRIFKDSATGECHCSLHYRKNRPALWKTQIWNFGKEMLYYKCWYMFVFFLAVHVLAWYGALVLGSRVFHFSGQIF